MGGYGVLRLAEVRPGLAAGRGRVQPGRHAQPGRVVTDDAVLPHHAARHLDRPLRPALRRRAGVRGHAAAAAAGARPTATAPIPAPTGTASRCPPSRSSAMPWPRRWPRDRRPRRGALGDARRRPPRPRDRAGAPEPGRVPGHVLGEPRPGPVAARRHRAHLPPRDARAGRVPRLRAGRGRRSTRTGSRPTSTSTRPALLRASATGLLLIDDGYPAPGEGYGWERMGELAGCPARPVMRIERVAEEGLGGGFDEFRERVRAEVASARARGFVGLKTIAAYRTGLDVARPTSAPRGRPSRPAARGWRPSRCSSWRCGTRSRPTPPIPLPVQLHAGFGDSDLLLPRADPTWLKPVVRALSGDAVRAAALLPVRARGRLARARVRQRVLRPVAHDPARVPAGRDGAPGARAGAGLQAALRERRRPHAGALSAGRPLVAEPRSPRCWPPSSRPPRRSVPGR